MLVDHRDDQHSGLCVAWQQEAWSRAVGQSALAVDHSGSLVTLDRRLRPDLMAGGTEAQVPLRVAETQAPPVLPGLEQ